MYAGYGFRPSEIGDVDVVLHDGRFHLFHLVLPNHDYIAHAVSDDGLTWRRVQNALFISDPGGWDDDMLWTMHVSRDPHREGGWRMFYTGLCMREAGLVQRVGLARSTDLFDWEKAGDGDWPLEIPEGHYEHSPDQGRRWVSFRDPYFARVDGRGYLLAAARAGSGPLIRRGCVALAEEVAPDRFEFRAPLFHPRRYDDVEVPGLVEIGGRWFLLGSIREDVKVHWWYADEPLGPYRNRSDNVLLPQGNYAARVCRDPDRDRLLVWNFYFPGDVPGSDRSLPPPKQLEASASGALVLRSYSGFDDQVTGVRRGDDLAPITALFGTPDTAATRRDGSHLLRCPSGFEAFLLPGEHADYRLSGVMEVEEKGKIGLALHLRDDGDGYFVSLDLEKGIAQIRFWAADTPGGGESAFTYLPLQAAHLVPRPGPVPFTLLSYGTYLELSLYGEVALSLADPRHRSGRVGWYVESAALAIRDLALETLRSPPRHPYASQTPVRGAGDDGP